MTTGANVLRQCHPCHLGIGGEIGVVLGNGPVQRMTEDSEDACAVAVVEYVKYAVDIRRYDEVCHSRRCQVQGFCMLNALARRHININEFSSIMLFYSQKASFYPRTMLRRFRQPQTLRNNRANGIPPTPWNEPKERRLNPIRRAGTRHIRGMIFNRRRELNVLLRHVRYALLTFPPFRIEDILLHHTVSVGEFVIIVLSGNLAFVRHGSNGESKLSLSVGNGKQEG
mmetsp:Transcript_41578/g.71186  ORF Transcript_41578/g.71186 Transcript_41578/m.71186 type:complete len:227 (-) Transcript_41578:362-1042(-)